MEGAERRLRPLIEYVGPRTGNLEGFALAPTTGTNHWCFLTDDDNLNGEAILWFRQFQPVEDTDADSLSDDWELRYWGTTTHTVGSADSDLDGMTNAEEQTAGTDPTDASSVFTLLSAVATPDQECIGVELAKRRPTAPTRCGRPPACKMVSPRSCRRQSPQRRR